MAFPPSEYQNLVTPSASLGLYMILIPWGLNGGIFTGSLWKSLIFIFLDLIFFTDCAWNITQSELVCTTYLYAIHTAPRHMCLRQKIATEQVWRGSTPHLKSLLCTQKTRKMPEMIRALWIQTDHWYKTYAQINRNRIWISSICKEIVLLIHVDIQSWKLL